MALIRPAQPDDIAFLLRLTERLAAFPVPPWRTAGEIAGADHRILLEALRSPAPTRSLLIAEDPPGQPAGYVFSTTQEDYFTHQSNAHIEILAVEAGVEGRGIGRQLIAAAEAWARGRGYRAITLNVFAPNERARSVYERLGYEPETLHYYKPLAMNPLEDPTSGKTE